MVRTIALSEDCTYMVQTCTYMFIPAWWVGFQMVSEFADGPEGGLGHGGGGGSDRGSLSRGDPREL